LASWRGIHQPAQLSTFGAGTTDTAGAAPGAVAHAANASDAARTRARGVHSNIFFI
jgi:hypothetical protein